MLAATLWPVIPATGAGALTASLDLVHGYTYDVHPGSATATFTTSGLGAPATYVPALARHAVDDESHGPLAGPTTNGAIGYTTYDPDVPLVQDASGSGTTQAAFGSHEEESAALRDAIVAANGGSKIPWTSWQNYPKVTQGGREYAQVGDRLYARHAVDRMQPSGLGAPAGAPGPGRSISPNYIEDVLTSSRGLPVKGPNGEPRLSYTSGTVQVITEDNIVITVITR